MRTFLALSHRIPSHHTLRWVFARLDTARFEEGFRDWVKEAFVLAGGQVVPIDGKRVRGSHDRGRDLGPLHLVGTWA
ncbi:MAG: transposase family protein [Caldilineaceae bacterium SB0662_bin_9]|uniref:Transposase family protein n=1 Tax=Caldilineaceae bacterium SB0662_bin_9 TaxID=2605258 RepID=A0A6B1DYN2_9CHLR|nr:transposase family protein [Caldilineaceae bacterium SB0662_bin_9]